MRRPLGLFAFLYAFLHFSVWMLVDLGFTPFVLLIPLAVTSTKGWIRRLKEKWTRLHALVYVTTPKPQAERGTAKRSLAATPSASRSR